MVQSLIESMVRKEVKKQSLLKEQVIKIDSKLKRDITSFLLEKIEELRKKSKNELNSLIKRYHPNDDIDDVRELVIDELLKTIDTDFISGM